MTDQDLLAERFEANRDHLRAVAYRMLGSAAEADDAVQEAWLRLSRADTDDVANLRGWLTTVVARISLDRLRWRRSRREDAVDELDPEARATSAPSGDPAAEAELADSVGVALLVVLEHLDPAERLAFVLHDLFAVPYDEIAPLVGRTPVAARQLASRARRRVQGSSPSSSIDLAHQRQVVEAFLTASRGGSLEGLLAVLDPDVVLRVDASAVPPGVPTEVHGAEAVAGRARLFAHRSPDSHLALLDGEVGLLTATNGHLTHAFRPTVVDGRIVAIDIVANPARLAALEVAVLPG